MGKVAGIGREGDRVCGIYSADLNLGSRLSDVLLGNACGKTAKKSFLGEGESCMLLKRLSFRD